jgi:hypothetical protein
MVADESAVVVQKRGNVGEEVLGPINAVRGLVAFKVVPEAHLEGLHEHVEREEDWRQLDLVAGPAGVGHALELRHLQVEQLDNSRLPLLPQHTRNGGLGGGPVDLLEEALEVGGKGIADRGTEGVRDLVDMV